jgi:hypothetical protein
MKRRERKRLERGQGEVKDCDEGGLRCGVNRIYEMTWWVRLTVEMVKGKGGEVEKRCLLKRNMYLLPASMKGRITNSTKKFEKYVKCDDFRVKEKENQRSFSL